MPLGSKPLKRSVFCLALLVTSAAFHCYIAESREVELKRSNAVRTKESERLEQKRSLRGKQFTRQQYEDVLARLDTLVRTKDRLGIMKVGDEIAEAWGRMGGESYGLAMLEVSNLLANSFRDDQSSEKYAFEALANSDTFSLRLEAQLLGFIRRDLNSAPSAWRKERSAKARLWLRAWSRLERGINRNFNFNNRPFLNVCPPDETGLPCGVAPEGIKDARLRAKYEAAIAANTKKSLEFNRQFELRYLDETFPKRASEYLAKVYSEPPYDLPELSRYLTTFGVNEAAKKSLLSDVAKRISQAPP